MPRLKPNVFLQLVPNRVESALRRVRETIWGDRTALSVEATAPTEEHRSLAIAHGSPLRAVVPGTAWGRLYDQRWYRVRLPSNSAGRYLEWRDQGEATLHVDGTPYYGFDVAHRRVALPPGAREVWVEAYCCQSAIWHPEATGLSPQGSIFDGAFLVSRNDEAWAVHHDLQCLFDLMMHLRARQQPAPARELSRAGLQPSVDQATPVYRVLLHRLSAALDRHDRSGLGALRHALKKIFREFRAPRSPVHAVLTGHAHIDLVWLWPERMGEAKAVHTFATMDRLMTLYPEFRFAYSQPASYRAVERRAPALARAIEQRISSGRWEATGALEVESDTLLPCGEALARSFLLGQNEFSRLSGRPARLLWLPDVFGYSGCLPQLMRLAGVEWFFTTKLTWNGLNRFPHSSFVWRGTDGSEVIAHVTQDAGYNNQIDLAQLHASANGHAQAGVHQEFLHPTGYGDGGGGTTEEMCERVRRLSALADTPAIKWDQPETFFARLAKHRRQLPVHQGECYLEYHRGTYTTHGDLKAAYRSLERALQVREAVAVATGQSPDLTATWRRLVFAQFHDNLPGSSVAEVYAESVPELARLAREEFAQAQSVLEKSTGDWHVFNPLAQTWRGWVRPAEGKPLWAELPPLTGVPRKTLLVTPIPVTAHERVLTNDRVRAKLGTDGWLRRLSVEGREIAFTGPAAQAVLYPDIPANYDSWDIDQHSLALGRPVTGRATIRIESNQPDRAILVVERKLGKASQLTLRYILQAGEAVLRIEAELDWHEQHTLLKLHFPTAYRGSNARFGAPFGSVLRGQKPGQVTTEAQWEVPGSRWAAVANDGEREGLALITESKYGFLARDGELTVSLVRSPRFTGYDDHRYAAPAGLSRHQPTSTFTDQGRHVIRLAIGSYDLTAPIDQQPATLADSLYTTPMTYRGKSCSAGLLGIIGASTLIPAWAQPIKGSSWILRLHEVAGQSGRAILQLAPGWTATACGLDGKIATDARPGKHVSFRPYEIISLKLTKK